MPKRISVRVPEPEEVEVEVTPTRFEVSGQYGGFKCAVDIVWTDDGWMPEDGHRRFSCRDEATEWAVQRVCARIARSVAVSRVDRILA